MKDRLIKLYWTFISASLTAFLLSLPFTMMAILDILNSFGLFIPVVVVLSLISLIWATLFFVKNRKTLKVKHWLLIGLCCSYFIAHFFHVPVLVEKIHLLIYAALAIVFQKTLSLGRPFHYSFWCAMILALLVGIADESLQGLVPGRVASLGDIYTNSAAIMVAMSCRAILEWARYTQTR